MGIATKRVDLGTFGLGSGIAGLGGVALSQLGNVGPELGQGYIIDSFMVVVLGGVGKLVGTIAGALGLGIVNKLLEPAAGGRARKDHHLGHSSSCSFKKGRKGSSHSRVAPRRRPGETRSRWPVGCTRAAAGPCSARSPSSGWS